MPVMHQAVKAYLANQRQGNAATKTRGYVDRRQPEAVEAEGHRPRASGLDPRAALGGRRHGLRPDRRAATTQYVPRQVRALARKSAFNARAREDAIFVIDRVRLRRAEDEALLGARWSASASTSKKVLILTDGVKPNVFLSGRNLPNVHVMPYADVSTYHILWSDVVLDRGGARSARRSTPVDETDRRRAEARRRRRRPERRGEARRRRRRRRRRQGREEDGRARRRPRRRRPQREEDRRRRSRPPKEEGEVSHADAYIAPSCARSSPRRPRRRTRIAANTRSRSRPTPTKPADPPGDRGRCSA